MADNSSLADPAENRLLETSQTQAADGLDDDDRYLQMASDLAQKLRDEGAPAS